MFIAPEEAALLTPEQNGHLVEDTSKSTDSKLVATVKSLDGKFHKTVFDPETKSLEFVLLRNDLTPTSHLLSLTLNEILTISSSKIKLRSGLPKNVSNRTKDAETSNVLYIYYAHRRNVYVWRLREAVLKFSTPSEKKIWLDALTSAINALNVRPKSLYIFINPFGGKGKGTEIYQKYVEPFFQLVDMKITVIKTERANHAYDMLLELPADEWNAIDGIVSVGGDGLFNEVLSSVIVRTQAEHGKNVEDINTDSLVTPRIRFGIIGAGSANSIVSSVHGVDDWSTAAIHIAIGSKCSVDVCTVHDDKKLKRISANAISYGWLGDVLHDSEHYRCMGPIRYQYSALRTSIRHPTYFGRVSFALSDPRDADKVSLPKCTTPCEICEGKTVEPDYPFHLQNDFTHVICCVIPCVSPFTPYGLAPYTGVSDGSMDLALVPKVSRCQNLQIMRKVSMYGGKGLIRLMQSNLYVYRVSRWKFTPPSMINEEGDATGRANTKLSDTNDTEVSTISVAASNGVVSDVAAVDAVTSSGAWNLDGEILPQPEHNSLHFRLHAHLINYFGRELDLDDPRYQKCFCCHHPKSFSKIVVVG